MLLVAGVSLAAAVTALGAPQQPGSLLAHGVATLAATTGIQPGQPAPAVRSRAWVTGEARGGPGPLTAAPLPETGPGDVLVAVAASDGAVDGQRITAVRGGGLTWRRAAATGGHAGVVEVWYASSAQRAANVTVSADRAQPGYHGAITVVALTGADATRPIGATARVSATGGATRLALGTVPAGSLVIGGGNDYDRAQERRPLTGQVLLGQFVDRSTGDTYWAERTAVAPAADLRDLRFGVGTPASGRWNLAAVVVRAAGSPVPVGSPSPTPTTTIVPTPAPSASPRPVPTPTASPTSGPGPTPAPPAAGWPDATNTGIPAGTVLKRVDSSVRVDTDGTVFDGYDFHGGLDVYADNVTIKNSRISNSGGWWGVNQRVGHQGLTVMDSEIAGDGVHQMQYGVSNAGGMVTVLRVNMHTISNGFSTSLGLLQDSYLHDPRYFSGDHTDMTISTGGRGPLVIRHNTIVNTLDQTGAVALFDDFSPIDGALVDHNLLAGGGYTVYGGTNSATNVRVVNNVFSRRVWPNGGHWGPVAYWNGAGAGNVWAGNTWEGTGAPVTP